jgi:hypothetical protein
MSSTFDVSQKLISELKELSLKKLVGGSVSTPPSIAVTSVVQRLTFPFAICAAIVELFTTVYKVPLIVAVSPTLAFGHLHVPFSK